MRSLLVGVSLAFFFAVPVAWAQGSSDSGGTDTSVADRHPSENVRGGAVRERAPGRTIDLARARHRELRDARLAAQRSGETSALAPEPAATSGSGSLGDLLGGSLGDLLGGSLGSVVNTLFNTGVGGTSTPSSGTDLSNLPPEVIQMLEGAGINLSDLTQRSRDDATTVDTTTSKTSSRAQEIIPQEERDFVVRWADAMLSTFFAALTVGFQTPDFIDVLKDLFRPVLFPQDAGADQTDGTTGNGDGNNGSGGNETGDGEEPLI